MKTLLAISASMAVLSVSAAQAAIPAWLKINTFGEEGFHTLRTVSDVAVEEVSFGAQGNKGCEGEGAFSMGASGQKVFTAIVRAKKVVAPQAEDAAEIETYYLKVPASEAIRVQLCGMLKSLPTLKMKIHFLVTPMGPRGEQAMPGIKGIIFDKGIPAPGSSPQIMKNKGLKVVLFEGEYAWGKSAIQDNDAPKP
jgi:hypothetical protein